MKRIAVLIILLSAAEVLCAQGNNNNNGNNGNGNNGGGNDTFVQHRNLRVNKNLSVLQNTELSGQLRVEGLSFFNNSVSIGSTTSPTETLDVFGNLKTRGTVFAENLNVQFSAEFGEDISIGQDLFVTRYGYFDRVGIGITGIPTESLDVNGNIKASDKLLSNSVETTLGSVADAWDIGGALTVGGAAAFSSDAIIDGLVGIGVSSPTEKLEVSGNIKATQALLSQSVTTSELSSETASISGTLDVEGVTTLNNNLDVSGNQTLGGTLDVTGISSFNTEVNIGGNTLISGSVGIGNTAPSEKLDVTGNAKVSEALTANTVNAQQANADDVDVSNTLAVDGATTLNDQLSVSGTTIIDGNLGLGVEAPAKKLDVAGDGQVSGAFSANSISSETFSTSDLEVSNTLTVDGLTTLNDNLNLTGTASIGGNTLINGNLGLGTSTPGEKLDVVGNASISQTLTANTINTQSFSSENLEVRNAMSVGGATTLGGNLSVAGTSTMSGNLGLGVASPVEKLEVAGNAKISQTLTASTINADEFSSDNLEVINTLNVGGATTLSGSLSVAGNSTMSGNLGLGVAAPTEKLEVGGNMKVTQNATIQNNATVSNQLLVNGNVGVGVTEPSEKLHVNGNLKLEGKLLAKSVDVDGFSSTTIEADEMTIKHDASVLGNLEITGNIGLGIASPEEKLHIDGGIKVSEGISSKSVSAQSGTFNKLSAAELINPNSGQNLVLGTQGAHRMTILSNGRIGIGTSDPDEMLTVAGDIHGQRVKVTIEAGTGPDYVFKDDYQLRTLSEIEDYIKSNSHLPEVPSAKEMESEGVELGEMNMLLLKKIEELTLYQIELLKRLEELEKKIGNSKK